MGLEALQNQDEMQVPPTVSRVGDGSVTLRGKPADKAKTGAWRAAAFIYVLIFGNATVLVSVQGNLMIFGVEYLHLDFATAANLLSNLAGTGYLLPIFFGFLADAYFGPFWVIVGACVLYAAGLTTLVLSVSLPSLIPPRCDEATCQRASQHIISVFEAGLFITCAAMAAVKPTVLSLGQQQFDETDPIEKKKGTLFFSLFYAVFNLALLVCTIFFFWIQTDVGFLEGYAITAGLFFLCAALFFTGVPFLRHQQPTGSPLTTLAQVMVAAVRNRRMVLPADPSELYEVHGDYLKLNIRRIRKIAHTNRLRFLDKAAIIPHDTVPGADHHQGFKGGWDNWKVCTVTQVEVLKIVIQMIPIWLCCALFYLMASQELTFFVQQAVGMDRSLGPNFDIPPATMTSASMFGGLVFIGVYETWLVPVFRKRTGHPRGLSPLVRIGMALFLALVVTVIAALVEIRRVQIIRDEHLTDFQVSKGLVPMSAYWLVPQLVVSGVCNPLMGTAQLELFYQEAPETMVSLAVALTFASQAIGRFISTGVVDSVKKYTGDGPGESWLTSDFNTGGLTKFLWLIAVILAVTFIVYLVASHFYTCKKLEDQTAYSSKTELVEAPSESQIRGLIPPFPAEDIVGKGSK